MTLAIVILAAGHGTRMNSKRQKVLHKVGGKPMIMHIFEAAERVSDRPPVVVIGAGETGVQQLIGDRAQYVVQEERLGTGHATMKARSVLEGEEQQVLVTYGDMPLLRSETMQRLAQKQAKSGAAVVMVSVMGAPDSTFGRVVRDSSGQVAEIVEVAQARRRGNAAELLAIRELNVGIYCFDAGWLWANLSDLPLRQARSGSEYYVTDMIALAVSQDKLVEAQVAEDADEGLSAGTRAELAAVEKAFRRRVNRRWMDAGVTLIDPETVYVDESVRIGQDTIIWPNTYLQGATTVGEACILGPNAILRNATLGPGCHVEQAVVEGVSLKEGTVVPLFTHMQPSETAE